MAPVQASAKAQVVPWEERLDAFVYRNRAWIGPPMVAGVLVGVAAGAKWLGLHWWITVLACIVLVLGLDSVSDLPVREDHRWWRRQEERLFGGSAWLVGCAWTAYGSWVGVSWWLSAFLGILATPLAILWFKHRRIRRSVEVDRKLAAWGDGSAVGLPGTHVRAKDAGAGWFSYRLKADEAGRYTIGQFKQAAARIAAKHGVRANAVSFEPTDDEGVVVVTVREEERRTVEYKVTSEPLPLMGEHTIGERDNGEPLKIALNIPGRGAQHCGAVGASGSGKSSLANRITEILVRAPEALPWLFDFSPGAQELRAWAPASHMFITNTEDAERAYDAARAICEYRGHTSKSRLFVPDCRHKHIGLVVDEAATMFAPELLATDASSIDRVKARQMTEQRRQKHEQGIRLFRKYGASEWAFTQYGDAEAFGGPVSRDQLTGNGYAIAFSAPKDLTGHLVIPAGHGLHVSQIPKSKPGTCGMLGPLTDGLVMGRIEYMSDADIRHMAEEWADRQGDLLPGEIDAADRATDGWFSARPRAAPASMEDDFGGGLFAVPEPDPQPVVVQGRKRMGSAEESRELIFRALVSLGAGGGKRADVVAASGKADDIVSIRLRELADACRVVRPRVRNGRWTVAEQAATPAVTEAD